jgi:hypothetical protein
MGTLAQLDRISIDWSNFDEASRITQSIVQELAGNRSQLRSLALAVRNSERLFSLAEKHGELTYIVLYDALDRGMRIRLHKFSKPQEDIPHNHRFSFSSTILAGSYTHTVFDLDRADATTNAPPPWRLSQPPGTQENGVEGRELQLTGFTPLLTTVQRAGSCYSLHHNTIHKTAMPVEDAFSVFLRGPAQKLCALQLEPDGRSYRWKFGRQYEDDRVLNERRMTAVDYDAFVESLEEARVI